MSVRNIGLSACSSRGASDARHHARAVSAARARRTSSAPSWPCAGRDSAPDGERRSHAVPAPPRTPIISVIESSAEEVFVTAVGSGSSGARRPAGASVQPAWARSLRHLEEGRDALVLAPRRGSIGLLHRHRRGHRERAAARALHARRQPLGRRRARRRDGARLDAARDGAAAPGAGRWSRSSSTCCRSRRSGPRAPGSSPACPSTPSACSRRAPAAWSSPKARAAPPSSTGSATRWSSFGTGFVRLALADRDADRAVRLHRRRRRHPDHDEPLQARQAVRRALHPGDAVALSGAAARAARHLLRRADALRTAPAPRRTRPSTRYVEQVKQRIAALIDDGRASASRHEERVP